MRILSVIAIAFLGLTMLAFWLSVLRNTGNVLEFEHPSRSMEHAKEKEIFIDNLGIIKPDTIKTNRHESIDILPISCWIEKKPYWKSGTMEIDSLGFISNTVVVIVNFVNFKNGKTWRPLKSGYNICDFQDSKGQHVSVYMDDDITQLHFQLPMDQLGDTIRLTTTDREQIVLFRN